MEPDQFNEDFTRYTDLKEIIKDDSPVARTVKQRCKFKGCITLLNHDNRKNQLFCSVHQNPVQMIIDFKYAHKDYHYYKNMVKDHNNKLRRGRRKRNFKRRTNEEISNE